VRLPPNISKKKAWTDFSEFLQKQIPQETGFSKEYFLVMTCSQLGAATLSNPTKGWGAKCISIAYHRLICGYWRCNIFQ
jgi:hypothetical protein